MGLYADAIRAAKQGLDAGGLKLRFLMVGGLNTVFGLGIFPLLMWVLRPFHLFYMIPLVMSYPLGIVFSYATNKFITFRTKKNYVAEFGKFSTFYIINFLVNLAVLPICVEWFHLPPIPSQFTFALLGVMLSYLWHSRITFRIQELVVGKD
jgi:putative flippase GtrA